MLFYIDNSPVVLCCNTTNVYCISIVIMVICNDDGVTFSQVTAMQCNMLTIYYYAYVCSSTCCVANKVTLTLTLLVELQIKLALALRKIRL